MGQRHVRSVAAMHYDDTTDPGLLPGDEAAIDYAGCGGPSSFLSKTALRQLDEVLLQCDIFWSLIGVPRAVIGVCPNLRKVVGFGPLRRQAHHDPRLMSWS